MRLRELTALLDSWYDPAWAEEWDQVGLVCGDPEQEVRRVLFAVDPVEAVVDEALELGADLVVVHHPLLLTATSSVAATTPKGRVVHRLVRAGVALFTAHTNADVPADGVNAAIAEALGLREPRVLVPTGPPGSGRGHGRLGRLAEDTTLQRFAERVAAALPATAHGVRVAGDPQRVVRTVAVGAGAGDSFLDDVRRSGVDVYVTSDLRHHRASESGEAGGPALVDVAHWAAESLWLPVVERKVRAAVAAAGDTVDTRVSTLVTDPWTFRV